MIGSRQFDRKAVGLEGDLARAIAVPTTTRRGSFDAAEVDTTLYTVALQLETKLDYQHELFPHHLSFIF